jgi:hypothetical protein
MDTVSLTAGHSLASPVTSLASELQSCNCNRSITRLRSSAHSDSYKTQSNSRPAQASVSGAAGTAAAHLFARPYFK